jgi:hypothetical protein
MRFLLSIVIIAIFGAIIEWFFPWWTIAIVALALGYLSKLSTWKAFLAGFCGIALLWLGFALWRDIPNQHILSSRMALLFKLPSFGWYLAVTAILGGLIGGLSAWSGVHLKRMIQAPM